MSIRKLAAAAFLGVAALGLSACATGLPTQVSRYQAMPAPQGQSFFVVPANGQPAGLEFSRYAAFVSQAMQAQGYAAATSPQAASMLVRLNYGVDEGQTEYREDPFYGSRGFYSPYYGGYYGNWGRPLYYSRYSPYRYSRYSPFYYGWDDPFYSPFDSGIDSFTVYKSFLDMNIVRRVDNAPLFEGHAKARSSNDNLGNLVPNLVEAMFTGFPGRNGETVRITVPPRKS
ncbi:MAG: DUF4136 domain-containing protein [Sphingomicrobium sp.]